MSKNKLFGIIFILCCSLSLLSCEKSDNNDNNDNGDVGGNNHLPITVLDPTGNEVHGNKYIMTTSMDNGKIVELEIKGGDGDYSFTKTETDDINIDIIRDNIIRIEPLGVGNTTVTIKDKSENTYKLDVSMEYYTVNVVITKVGVVINGNTLTDAEKEAITTEALATIPVKVGGGYKFTHLEFMVSGKLTLYANDYETKDDDTKKIDFRINEADYIFDLGEGERKFSTFVGNIRMPSIEVALIFTEDITATFKDRYPSVERVRTQQQFYER